MKNKRPASMLISAILASVMFIIIANSFMNLWGNSFTTLTAAKTATEAQNLSDIVSEKLKLEGVDAEEVTTKTPLSDITGNDDDDDWLYTYEIGNEFEDDDGNIFKVAEVKIYKDGEDNPRYSTEIPLSSSGSNLGKFNYNEKGYYWKLPNGLIFQWGYKKSSLGWHHTEHIDFPIEFPNRAIMGTGDTQSADSELEYNSGGIDNLTKTGMDISCEHTGAYWLAIGN